MAELPMRLVLEGLTGGVSIGGIRLINLWYADDIILIAGPRLVVVKYRGHVPFFCFFLS